MANMYGYTEGRRDLERVGYFGEMSYLHGKGYNPPLPFTNIRDMSKSQMYPGYPKWKADLQDCYFDQTFKRVFAKEGWSTPFIRQLKEQMVAKQKNISPQGFTPSSYTKKQACPGDFFGTLGGPVKAFSPLLKKPKDGEKKEKEPPNVLTQPAKKGGPGYPDICLNKYPQYKGTTYDDPFLSAKDPKRQVEKVAPFLGGGKPDYFDKNPYLTKMTSIPTYRRTFQERETKFGPFMPSQPAKKRGDRKHGGMTDYPAYKSDKPREVKKVEKELLGGPFYPQIRDRTKLTPSVMAKKMELSVTSDNWRTAKAVTYTKEYY